MSFFHTFQGIASEVTTKLKALYNISLIISIISILLLLFQTHFM